MKKQFYDKYLYNYIDQNLNHNISNKVILINHLDYVKLSIKGKNKIESIEPLFDKIQSISTYSRLFDFKYFGYNQIRVCKFEFNNVLFKCVFMRNTWDGTKPILFVIHDPTPDVLLMIESYLNKKIYHINTVECTYDFHSLNLNAVATFLVLHGFLKWRGKGFVYRWLTSVYYNNLRKSTSKGARAYEKEETVIINGVAVKFRYYRLEIDLKRRLLKNKKMNINTLSDVVNMTSDKPARYFDFRFFNFDKLEKFIIKAGYTDEEYHYIMKFFVTNIKYHGLWKMNELAKQFFNIDNISFLNKHQFTEYLANTLCSCIMVQLNKFDISTDMFVVNSDYCYR